MRGGPGDEARDPPTEAHAADGVCEAPSPAIDPAPKRVATEVSRRRPRRRGTSKFAILMGVICASMTMRLCSAFLHELNERLPDAPVTQVERPASCAVFASVRAPKALAPAVATYATSPLAVAQFFARGVPPVLGPILDTVDGSRPLLVCADPFRGAAFAMSVAKTSFDAAIASQPHERSDKVGRAVYRIGTISIARFDDVVVIGESSWALEELGPYLAWAARTAPAHAFELHVPQDVLRRYAGQVKPDPSLAEDDPSRAFVDALRAHTSELGALDADGDVEDGFVTARVHVQLTGSSATTLDAAPKLSAVDVRDSLVEGAELAGTGSAFFGLGAHVEQLSKAVVDPDSFREPLAVIRAGLAPTASLLKRGDESVVRFVVVDEARVREKVKEIREGVSLKDRRDEKVGERTLTRVLLPSNASGWALVGSALWISATVKSEGLLEAALRGERETPSPPIDAALRAPGLLLHVRGSWGEVAINWAVGRLDVTSRVKPASIAPLVRPGAL